jgi:hypothetical protein
MPSPEWHNKIEQTQALDERSQPWKQLAETKVFEQPEADPFTEKENIIHMPEISASNMNVVAAVGLAG